MKTGIAGGLMVALWSLSAGCGGELFLGTNPDDASTGNTCASPPCTTPGGGMRDGGAGPSDASVANTPGDAGGGAAMDVEQVPQPVVVSSCGASTEQLPFTPGVGLDISQAKGYTPDPTTATSAAALLQGASAGGLANQMRGTPPLSGGVPQFSDIFRTLDDSITNIRGFKFRNGTRGVTLDNPIYSGAFGAAPLDLGNGYSTAFPAAAARAAAWDLALEEQIGEDMGDEVLTSQNTAILAPGVDLLRHPAWGRAQESYGEDSFAVGRMATAYAVGAQQYVPACATHLAAYNIENGRFSQNSILDDQTLHEVYGRPFEMVVQEGGVACVMAAYNSVQVSDLDNVSYKDTSNPILLTDMLRGTFGFKGFVMTDEWAMPGGEAVNLMPAQYAANALGAVGAGLDLEMPWALNFANLETVASPAQLSASATRIVEQKVRFNIAQRNAPMPGLRAPVTSLGPNGITNNAGHIADAERQAEESMVLLKNAQHTLPIDRTRVRTIAVIGVSVPWSLSGTGQTGSVNFPIDPRLGDNGSSHLVSDPATSEGPALGIKLAADTIDVVSGSDPVLADTADFVVVVAGLTPEDEGEEYTGAGDRLDGTGAPNLGLDPKSGSGAQNALIAAVAAKNKPMVVVLEGGSAIDMPWLDSVPAVIMAWYPGQAGGTALGHLLFGDTNFSGKLPITWPNSVTDEPALNGGGNSGGNTTMDYYVGYRYFDKNHITPQFPIGYGLSYTTFTYDSLVVPCGTVAKDGVVDVWVAVTNTGNVPGNEVTFLFVAYPTTTARRSVKELKGFHRTPVPLQPGETTTFTIPLRVQDLKYWNTSTSPHGWTVESGPVQIMVGSSSDNLPLLETMTVQ
jgi:beta-glucosidase